MITEINNILSQFRSCFSRASSFNWFVITVIGFIVRLDHHGVSSVIRWLNLDPGKYTSLLLFFQSILMEPERSSTKMVANRIDQLSRCYHQRTILDCG